MRQFGDEIRRGGRDHYGVGHSAGMDVRHAFVVLPLVEQHRLSRERLHRGGRDEMCCRLRHRHLYRNALLHQQTCQFRRLVGRDAASDAEHDAFCLGLFHNAAHLNKKVIAMAITDWPAGERPREKLLQRGAAALSDAELLAIFLRTGVTGKSAVDLARDLLAQFGSLTQLFAASEKEFCDIHGMGQAKFVQLQAVLEMSRRALQEEMQSGDALNSPRAVREYLQLLLRTRPQEVFIAIFLDAQHRVIASEELFQGTLTQTSVYPREVVKRALHHNAAAVIFAHNHPSGVVESSQSDRLLTDALKHALQLVDVRVLDHFIVAGASCLSFAEKGML
jgi:DNA repair protein RadC